jgi:hypothetical protein
MGPRTAGPDPGAAWPTTVVILTTDLVIQTPETFVPAVEADLRPADMTSMDDSLAHPDHTEAKHPPTHSIGK